MSTCLTTVLDGTVNNSSLRTPGELRIIVKKQDNYIQSRSWFALTSRVNQVVTLINDKEGNNYFFDIQGVNLGTSVEFFSGVSRTVYCTNGTFEISIPNKYALSLIKFLRVTPQTDFFTIDIDELKYLPTLEVLEISDTTSKGDIKSLAATSTLYDLTIEYTNIKGDLEDISNLNLMTYLRLGYSQNLTGNISIIENMPRMITIDLIGCMGINGNISSLGYCPALSYFRSPCIAGIPSFVGDISAFSNCPALTHVEIKNELDVTGDIAVFASNTKLLNYLNLYNCDVYGDIEDLSPCNRLSTINVQANERVVGDLGAFLADKPMLLTVVVTNTGVTGDVTNINVPQLVTFTANLTGITGSIGKVDAIEYTPDNENLTPIPAHTASDGFVKHCPSLMSINVSNTQISGDIDVFATCNSIATINVYNSNVSGNIASLAGLSSLTGFNVGFTSVYGDIGVGLANCLNLQAIYVEYCPYLYGDLSRLCNNMKYISASTSSGTFSWETTRSSTAYIISMNNVKLGDDLDAMLINQALCQPNNSATSTTANAIRVWGNRSADPTIRTNANNAIRALMNKGYSVTINGILQTDALIDSDAIDFEE